MTALLDLVPALKRRLAPQGFEATYPGVTDAEMAGHLSEAFAEAAGLDGLLPGYSQDLAVGTVTPDLDDRARSIVLLYAFHSFLVSAIANQKSATYKAGPAEYQSTLQGSLVLKAILDEVSAAKSRVQFMPSETGQAAAAEGFWMWDAGLPCGYDFQAW